MGGFTASYNSISFDNNTLYNFYVYKDMNIFQSNSIHINSTCLIKLRTYLYYMKIFSCHLHFMYEKCYLHCKLTFSIEWNFLKKWTVIKFLWMWRNGKCISHWHSSLWFDRNFNVISSECFNNIFKFGNFRNFIIYFPKIRMLSIFIYVWNSYTYICQTSG